MSVFPALCRWRHKYILHTNQAGPVQARAWPVQGVPSCAAAKHSNLCTAHALSMSISHSRTQTYGDTREGGGGVHCLSITSSKFGSAIQNPFLIPFHGIHSLAPKGCVEGFLGSVSARVGKHAGANRGSSLRLQHPCTCIEFGPCPGLPFPSFNFHRC